MKKVISTQNAPAAIGPYSQAIEVNGMVYTSGVIPVNPATGEIPDGAEAQTRQAMTCLLYTSTINIEAKAMMNIAGKQIIPAVIKYATSLATLSLIHI